MPQPVNRGLEQPVLLDVLGELVEGDLNGQRDAEAPPYLFVEPDASPHGVERVLLPPVAVEQPALDGLPGAAGKGEGNRFEDVVVAGQLDGVTPPVPKVHRVGDQEHNAVDGDLGTHDDSELADVYRADVGRRPESVRALLVGRGVSPQYALCRSAPAAGPCQAGRL